MKVRVFLLLILCSVSQVTMPIFYSNITVVDKNDLMLAIAVDGCLKWGVVKTLDLVLEALQQACSNKVNEINDSLRNCTDVKIAQEKGKRAAKFNVVSNVLSIPRIVTVGGTLLIPVLTVLSLIKLSDGPDKIYVIID